jgi:hypothetical protein
VWAPEVIRRASNPARHPQALKPNRAYPADSTLRISFAARRTSRGLIKLWRLADGTINNSPRTNRNRTHGSGYKDRSRHDTQGYTSDSAQCPRDITARRSSNEGTRTMLDRRETCGSCSSTAPRRTHHEPTSGLGSAISNRAKRRIGERARRKQQDENQRKKSNQFLSSVTLAT